MAEKKTILEEALLDIQNIQNALNANTKEILRSVAKEEIDGVVKESMKGYVEEEVEEALDEVSNKEHEKSETPAEENKEHGKGGTEKKEKSEMKSETKKMTEGEMSTEGMEEEGMYEEDITDETYEEGMDAMASEEIDLTQASDDDVIAIYKKLSGEDEIEIVGDEIHLTVSEPGEYIVKTSDLNAASVEPEIGDEDEVDYEIEMGDEDEESEFTLVDDNEEEEEEEEEEESEEAEEEEEEEEEEETIDEKISVGIGMSVGSHRGQGPKSIGAPENPKSESINEAAAAKKLVSETAKKYNSLLTEAKKLKVENDEFRTALKEFRGKLVETVVFNSNLTYVTRLFMEHATTKAEKQTIIKRFDEEVSNLKESKKLYRTIANELVSRKPIAESIENKIIKEATTSSSKQLNESTAYVDPSTKRILDLIQRVEKK
jgi:hypothetical protein